MKNPISKLANKSQKKIFISLLLLTISLVFVMNLVGNPLKNTLAPKGIVSFELAKDFLSSQLILNSWNETQKLYAALGLGIDFLFLFSYSFFFAFIIFKLSYKLEKNLPFFSNLGLYLAYLQFVAAFFDILENYSLIQLLFSSQKQSFSLLAFYCASLKFSIILMALIYIFLALVLLFFHRKKS